jgi:hypothetical protein
LRIKSCRIRRISWREGVMKSITLWRRYGIGVLQKGREEEREYETKKILMIWRRNAFFHVFQPLCSENSRFLKTDFLLTIWIWRYWLCLHPSTTYTPEKLWFLFLLTFVSIVLWNRYEFVS